MEFWPSFGGFKPQNRDKIEDKQVPSAQHKYSKTGYISTVPLLFECGIFDIHPSINSAILRPPDSAKPFLRPGVAIFQGHPGASHLLKRKHSNYTPKKLTNVLKKGPVSKEKACLPTTIASGDILVSGIFCSLLKCFCSAGFIGVGCDHPILNFLKHMSCTKKPTPKKKSGQLI